MKEKKIPKVYRSLIFLRNLLLILTGLIGIIWITSYFIGIERYQSHWSSLESEKSERANWFVSNYGSIGIAWRSQDGVFMSALPPDDHKFKTFRSSSEALNNVHPRGFNSWHWIHYLRTEPKNMGAMQTEYGHLYVPYWMPFLAICILGLALSIYINRKSEQASAGQPATTPESKPDGEKPKPESVLPPGGGCQVSNVR